MLAEVKAELGDEVTAKQYLSEVHNRAFATPELANLDGFISKWGGIKEAIQQERKLEFGGERPYGGAGEYHPPPGNVLCCQRGRPGGQDSDDNRRTYL
jgi:hypothetical protein